MKAVCPYCRVEVEAAVHSCPACSTPHHPECWEENRGCTVFGCSAAPPDEPKISLAAPPPPPGFLPPSLSHSGGAPPGIHANLRPDLAVVPRMPPAERIFAFLERNSWTWDYALAGLWGSALGGFAGAALGFLGGMSAMMFAGQFSAIFTFPAQGLIFGQSLFLVAGFLAVLFGGKKFTAFLRSFSQAFIRAVSPPRNAEDDDEFSNEPGTDNDFP